MDLHEISKIPCKGYIAYIQSDTCTECRLQNGTLYCYFFVNECKFISCTGVKVGFVVIVSKGLREIINYKWQ